MPELAALIASEFPDREFNIEGNPDARFVELVEAVKPAQVTLVPDDIRQSTSDHGWNIAAHRVFLKAIIARLKASGMRVSLFIDAEPRACRAPCGRGRRRSRRDLHRPLWRRLRSGGDAERELEKVVDDRQRRQGDAGLGLNAGHDLTLDNLPPLVAALPHLAEVSIGHALIADALIYGMAEAVRRYRAACGNPVAA